MRQHEIKGKVVFKKSRSICETDCNEWKEIVLKKISEEYMPDNSFKCLSNKILTFKGGDCHGGKLQQKEANNFGECSEIDYSQ